MLHAHKATCDISRTAIDGPRLISSFQRENLSYSPKFRKFYSRRLFSA